MRKATLTILLIVGFLASPLAEAYTQCKPTLLSYTEAKRLLMQVPLVIASQKAIGKIMITNSGPVFPPKSKWRHMFYYFQVDAASGRGGVLDNGLVGYYDVNKVTGQVINGVLLKVVKGAALAKLQVNLRDKHCISRALVMRHNVKEN